MVSSLVDDFFTQAVGSGAEVYKCAGLDEALSFVSRFLRENGQENLVISPDVQSILPERGCLPVIIPAKREDYLGAEVSLVRADYGIGSTGTLVHLDRNEEEKIVWTLPSACLCFLDGRRIVSELDELTAVLLGHLGDGAAGFRHVSLVTGPSRTADIEGQLTLGVQGPRQLIILLIL